MLTRWKVAVTVGTDDRMVPQVGPPKYSAQRHQKVVFDTGTQVPPWAHGLEAQIPVAGGVAITRGAVLVLVAMAAVVLEGTGRRVEEEEAAADGVEVSLEPIADEKGFPPQLTTNTKRFEDLIGKRGERGARERGAAMAGGGGGGRGGRGGGGGRLP